MSRLTMTLPDGRQARRDPAHAPGGRGATPPAGPYRRLKVAADFGLALILLVPALPLLAVLAALIRLTSRGPAFYSQVRLGLGGRPYRIYKLRTMAHDCEKKSGPRWSAAGDPRVTPLGRFLRKAHLDELPQLWNVLRGEMSLVGPRPERPEFVPGLEKSLPHYRDRLLVRPGVTGLAQIQLPPDTDLESVRRKLRYDLYYVRNLGALLDARVLLGTGLKLLGVSFAASRALLGLPAEGDLGAAPGPARTAAAATFQAEVA